MIQLRKRPGFVALIAVLLLVAAACSSSGGKKSEQQTATANAGKANTPNMTVAMVTHGAPSDTFWDIIRKGAAAAAAPRTTSRSSTPRTRTPASRPP